MRHLPLALLAVMLLSLPCRAAEATAAPFHAEDISNAGGSGYYRLTDTLGQSRTPEDFRGSVVLLYFGFTYCPDLCPTALMRLAAVQKRLGAEAAGARVIFVTLDPDRDTAEVLGSYVPSFGAGFVGLRGSAEATREAARNFKVFFQKFKGSTPDRYTVDHSDFIYVVDATTRPRLRINSSLSIDQMAEDIRRLIGKP